MDGRQGTDCAARRPRTQGHTLVNLGIGLPTLVAKYVPAGIRVYFQSENGIIGFGARPPEGMEDVNLTDAGGRLCLGALPGAVSFDSAMSFGAHSRRPSRPDRAGRPADRRDGVASAIG